MITVILLIGACKNKKAADQLGQATAVTKNQHLQPKAQIHTDTLQFIYFEGNFDYWSCIFLNSSKDTITLVTDSMIADSFKNKLFEVKWFTDTLVQAGDNDSKFAANRMSQFRPIKGKPFVAPITEEQILQDVRNIPEVQSLPHFYLIDCSCRQVIGTNQPRLCGIPFCGFFCRPPAFYRLTVVYLLSKRIC
ncbi:hypothetical protein [Pedobacter frigoris]|uniref:hypothetical protein n=1 Tax=Pedobacter frigoris TaxID=2571272 RepID=UPI0019814E45|nr:hypothetical protein [Pedobacter frigoris]